MTTTPTIPITNQQLSILLLLFRFRFLTRIQIQIILKHKHPSHINKYLKNLSDNNIIYKHYKKSYPENIRPALYCLDKKSISYLNKDGNLNSVLIKRIYKDKNRSQRFINHSLAIADLFIETIKQILESKRQLFFYTKTDLFEYDFLIKPFPDVYLAIEGGKKTDRYFIEAIDSDTPRFVLRNRIKKYIEYFLNNQWQINTGYPFPKILLICQNDSLVKYLGKFIETTLVNEGSPEINLKVIKTLPLL